MNVAAQSADTKSGDKSGDRAAASPKVQQKPPRSLSAILLMLGTGVLFGLLGVWAMLGVQSNGAATPTLEAVPASQLSDALVSLGPNGGGAAITAARRCEAPLGYLTVVAAPGATPGKIRIRSGAYVSPNILVTDAPRRIAIPYPAPYQTGRGIITIEGAAQDLRVWLKPVWQAPALAGAATISVTWIPKKPC